MCRRSDWPEREESISETTFAGKEVAVMIGNSYKTNLPDVNESFTGKQLVKVDSAKPHERSHWYLSNARGANQLWEVTNMAKIQGTSFHKPSRTFIFCSFDWL